MTNLAKESKNATCLEIYIKSLTQSPFLFWLIYGMGKNVKELFLQNAVLAVDLCPTVSNDFVV